MCCRRLVPYQISKQPLSDVLPGYAWVRTTNQNSFAMGEIKSGEDYYVLSPSKAKNAPVRQPVVAPTRSAHDSDRWVLRAYDRGDGKPISGYSVSDAWARGQREFERKLYAGVYGKL